MIRAVLDTNIIISGLFWQGTPTAVLRAGIVQTFALLFSPELITEVQEVISREKFARACAALGKTAAEIVVDLQSTAELVTPTPFRLMPSVTPKTFLFWPALLVAKPVTLCPAMMIS